MDLRLLQGMRRFLAKPYRWAMVFSVFLLLSFVLILLDTFVIPRKQAAVSGGAAQVTPAAWQAADAQETAAPVITDRSYADANITIVIETVRIHDTDVHIADIQLTSAAYLQTALAGDAFGRNIKASTSSMAAAHGAIFAINGDYYGYRDAGFVVRNGILYRQTARTAADDEALVIDTAGDFHILQETEAVAEGTALAEAWQAFCFGPALVEAGVRLVDEDSEVTYSPHTRTENPRTAIGQVGPLHYIVVVSDGRTRDSQGLTLLQLAELFVQRGCQVAYNLDGGGSSTMVFLGEIINRPTNGRSEKEREVSDIVYIGYE